MGRPQHSTTPRARRDFGRLLAQVACAFFALIGALPLLAGLLVRSAPVKEWAAHETARVLEEQLGVTAEYDVEMHLWPLEVALLNVRVPATDGGADAFTADRIAVAPQVFALIAGRLDVGDIEVDAPRARLVVRKGTITNVAYRLPERKAKAQRLDRAPFTSLAVTDGRFLVDLDGTVIDSGMTDVDVFSDVGPSFEVAVRASHSTVVRERAVLPPPPPRPVAGAPPPPPPPPDPPARAVDEDILCRLDVRVRFDPGDILVRRLSLVGFADADPARGTAPRCDVIDEDAVNRVALRLSQVRIERPPGSPPIVAGHVMARAPLAVTNRFVRAHPLRGWTGLVADFRYDGKTRLPEIEGKLRGGDIGYWRYNPAKKLEVEVEVKRDRIRLPAFEVHMADGRFVGKNAEVAPFEAGVPLRVQLVESHGVQFSGLMRDLGVAQHTVVSWDLTYTKYSGVAGTISPLDFSGKLHGRTGRFEVFDAGFDNPARRHMIGVASAVIDTRLAFTREAAEFRDATSHFGKSTIHAPIIQIGFKNTVRIEVDNAELDLADITPISTIPWAGKARLSMEMAGVSRSPVLTGQLAIDDFVFGGYPVGDVERSNVRFVPLKVDFTDVQGKKGDSTFVLPTARLDFDRKGALLIDANLTSPKLHIKDFWHMFHFDQDPRFTPIQGEGALEARIHYDLGGPEDRCGLGNLRVEGTGTIAKADIYEELYDGGHARFDFEWFDQAANYLGVNLDVPSYTLRKGTGTILGSLRMTQGAKLEGNVVATGIPLSAVQSFGALGSMVDARASAVATVKGSIDYLAFDSQVSLSPMRFGTATLPASELFVRLDPKREAIKRAGTTQCGLPIPGAFDRAAYERDPSEGTYVTNGELFGGQVTFEELAMSRQRFKSMQGGVRFEGLDLGAIAQLSPDVTALDPKPKGKLSGHLAVEHMKLADVASGRAAFDLTELMLEWGGGHVRLEPGAPPIVLGDGELAAPGLAFAVSGPTGPKAVFDVTGKLRDLGAAPTVEGRLDLRPLALASVAAVVPGVARAAGELRGGLEVSGPVASPTFGGGFTLEDGELAVHGFPAPLTDLAVVVELAQGELRLARASARVGAGSVAITGSAPIQGFELGPARGVIQVRGLPIPAVEGVDTAIDADLVATYTPPAEDVEATLPRVTGTVAIKSFTYTRPITMSADIASLAQRGKRTTVQAYDPDDDYLEMDITLKAERPLTISNNLVEASVELPSDGLRIAGTNQRFGATGTVHMAKGGRLRLRQHEFEIQQGVVRFDDVTRVAPEVDLTATTEYRRYDQAQGAETAAGAEAGSGTGRAAAGGRWLISLHAYGDAEALKVDMSSQPNLAQDDIFLLLTIGLTRAELDQAKSANVGGSVALEALGTLSGADQAVKEAVPVIDEFRFGSAYSSRTGRTEPTVTIGKRLADRIRANVTSGLSESREVRSNLEWEVGSRVSVEGSYDNVNDISSSSLGNLGADVRWRIEFE